MPIIPIVGRSDWRIRLLIIGIYATLSIGAITMVYPFLLMVSTSLASPVDQHDYTVIPKYLYNDGKLFQKYLESKYNEDINRFNKFLGTEYITFRSITPPHDINQTKIAEWVEYKQTLPYMVKSVGFSRTYSMITPDNVFRYRNFLKGKFANDLDSLNSFYKTRYPGWTKVLFPYEQWEERYIPEMTNQYRDFLEFRGTLPERDFCIVNLDSSFQEFLRIRYGRHIENYAETYKRQYSSRLSIVLKPTLPLEPHEAKDWEDFVRKQCPVYSINIDKKEYNRYQIFLRHKYEDINNLNRIYNTNYRDFGDILWPEKALPEGPHLIDWTEFIEREVSVQSIVLNTPQIRYRQWLEKRYNNIENLNVKYGSNHKSFEEIIPPYLESEWTEFQEAKGAVRKEFSIRNYREVMVFLAGHGSALINTVILCIGIISVTLIINPLCAYALSRFPMPATYKILLFLLATMAFPAEVGAIPAFLLIKEFHLLNTYWALILPTMANGFSIFLLKGFFDSLPKEIYESAAIEGAGELTMFVRLTVPMSMPVLAVIGLGAFTAGYGSFMWAFLVCQDQKMWTIMVWLFQLQTWAPQFIVFAGLVVAALPTLLVFIFCQNLIMRGIVLPVQD